MTLKVLVTGASGFIGQRLVNVLKMQGHWVKSVDRHHSGSRAGADIHVVQNISVTTRWADVLRGIDAIVHLADGSRVFESTGVSENRRAMEGCAAANSHLAASAIEQGIRSFIYVSSVKAVVGESASFVLTDEHKPLPTSQYGQLKLDVERQLTSIFNASPGRLVILRPALVYGPGCGGNFDRLMRLADTPWPLPFGGMKNTRSMIFVENFVDAVVTVLEQKSAPGGAYLVHDGAPRSICKTLEHMRSCFGRPTRLFSIPASIWGVAASIPPMASIADRITGMLTIDDIGFRRTFSWSPPWQDEQAVAATVASFVEAKTLKAANLMRGDGS
ncbi:MAG: NAD-dependent epimerase/dehydratase family protein [Hyphomicrobiaceae bacterium]|nr:NAD-dependent epimerase/dehydratase family protein [Hyphomicrobiaceae bacterium]